MRGLSWMIGILGAVALAVFALASGFMDEVPTTFNIIGGVGAAMIAGWLMLDWDHLKKLGEDQTLGRTLTAIVATLLALGIAVTLNVVGHRQNQRWDVTEGKQYTLSDQTVEIVKGLNREIEVAAFFSAGSPDEAAFKDLMERYAEHTSLLKVSFNDPYENPLVAEQMKITSETGTVVMKVGDKEQRLESRFDEESFTNAILKVTSDVQHSVCIVSGHGEADIADETTPEGLGFLKGKLDGQNYKVDGLSLLSRQPTPSDCEVVILSGPRAELLPEELDRLAAYVAGGGSLIALLDPQTPASVAADFSRYGVKIGTNVVIEGDPYRQAQGNPFAFILSEDSYDIHPLTQKLRGNSVMYLARSVDKGDDVAGLKAQVLARSSEQSWGEVDYEDPTGAAEPTPGRDIVGKVPLIVAVEIEDPAAIRATAALTNALPTAEGGLPAVAAPSLPPAARPPQKAGGKVVVFGDADFASNVMIASGLNQDLIMNAVAWMAGEESQISIRANEAGKGKMTVDLVSLFVVGIASLILAPAAAVMAAVGSWLRRRKL